MAPASLALRRALRDGLLAHAPLVAALGGPKIWDEPPRDAAFPYVTLGEARVTDWSTGSSSGHEHALTLHVWSRQGGQTEAQVVAGEIVAALEQVPLSPAGHRLVNLRFATADIRREDDGRTFHGVVRFRAVTEPG
ncbi:DUF3168 domain-containing protein [Phreatobacter cathodiphilus]|uniref:DUF3168 domain-containing protein n=1 Tax=Phreatobacter cathodiphilus TaxID=1868589 RepID=A0A2S0N7F6_9HYPH|nr:DUF3168 domain-containing protein [Phreatobacter cathodiphilus]AVO44065.1 DUF3168 domain-containing protein [Phreatobacter cathodiphilus]